jgi:A/G-specific adenine glycosylase
MERWPTPKDLAEATPAQVITAWGRLGYPRRALRLHAAAQIIAEDFNNQVPEDQETLQLLPGIGEYTAAAIAAFAFEQRSLVMDVNIRRLLVRQKKKHDAWQYCLKRMHTFGQLQRWSLVH